MLLTCCATTLYLPHLPRSRLPVCLFVAGQMSPFPAFCDLSLRSVLAVPIANRRFLFQPHPSHRYYQHPAGLCRGQRNDLAKCLEGFWDPIGHPFLRFCLSGHIDIFSFSCFPSFPLVLGELPGLSSCSCLNASCLPRSVIYYLSAS